MPTLREVQRAMRGHVLHADDAIAAMLSGDALPERLDVYRNTVGVSLTRALRLSFPAVHKLVGEAFFEAAAGIFLTDNPPRAACLDLYGEAFPEFLRALRPHEAFPILPTWRRSNGRSIGRCMLPMTRHRSRCAWCHHRGRGCRPALYGEPVANPP